ncbi:MAG: RNA polymerase sigma factor [Coprobacillaceae bacterium]
MNRLDVVSEETITKVIQGDSEAFTDIYNAYYRKVYFMGVQFFKNEETAKDIVQEVFIKVHKQINTLKSPNAFNSWIHVITYRECVSYTRKKSRVIDLREDQKIEDFEDINGGSVTDIVENGRVKEIIMESLDSMSTPLRIVGTLRFFEEMKIKEIADILDVPIDTVGTRVGRIKKILKTNLEEQGITLDKNYSLGLFSSALLKEMYALLSNKYILHGDTATKILQNTLKGNNAGKVSLLIKYSMGSLVTASVIGGLIINQNIVKSEAYLVYKEFSTLEVPQIQEDTKITEIIFDNNWIKEAVDLEVQTTNSNYDTVLINDMQTSRILDNGTYIVKLIKDGITIDQREIHICNIDRKSPNAKVDALGATYRISLTDDISGVNQETIQYYKNGVISSDYIYDSTSNTIVIENDGITKHEFNINDYATNTLNIVIGE